MRYRHTNSIGDKALLRYQYPRSLFIKNDDAILTCIPKSSMLRVLFKMAKKIMTHTHVECRLGCGACCIAPSISSSIPGMPNGKLANTRCIQLNEENLCKLFGKKERPKVCADFKPCIDICGKSNTHALQQLIELESLT